MSWQHPYVPVLASGMLDFLMAPTAFLMGCHSSHYKDVAAVSIYWGELNVGRSRASYPLGYDPFVTYFSLVIM